MAPDRPSDVWGDPSAQQFYWLGHNPLALVGGLRATRLYVSHGNGVPTSEELEEDGPFGVAVGGASEAGLGVLNDEFAAAARSAGVRSLTYRRHHGTHSAATARMSLRDAIAWRFFEPVPERPPSWSYLTVAQTGDAWGLRYRFATPPEEVERFTLSAAGRLAATGSGTVSIDTPDGCRLGAELPFERSLPSDEERPRSIIRRARFRAGRFAVRGTASDRGCGGVRAVARVELAVSRREGDGACRHLRRSGRLGRRTSCRPPHFLRTRGTSRWQLRRKARLRSGSYVVRSRAVDRTGNVERRRARARNRLVVRVR